MVFIGLFGQFVESAAEAHAVVAADNPVAIRAFPLPGFPLEKRLYAGLPDEFEVVY